MNLRSVDLNLLTVFDAIMTEGNMTRAAEKISMTQPAISLALSRLRHLVGDDLFVRTGRGVKPTPRALELSTPVRQALDLIVSGLEPSDTFDYANSTREFSLLLGDYGDILILPKLIKRIESLGSGIRLNIPSKSDLDIKSSLHYGQLDFHLWITPWDSQEVTHYFIGSESNKCLMRKDHPTSKKKLTAKEYAKLDHVVIDLPLNEGPSRIDKDLSLKGHERRHRLKLDSFTKVPPVLMHTDRVCTVPTCLAQHYAEHYPLKMLDPPINADIPIYLMWPNSRQNDPGHKWLKDMIIELILELDINPAKHKPD
jgi:DNA-binding transcriptional LysR family regulator